MREEGDDTAAEPVPVRRPGVCVTGVEVREELVVRLTGEKTGMTKIGLNLDLLNESRLEGANIK